MTNDTPNKRGSNSLGQAALTLSVLEILVIGGGCGIIYKMGLWGNAPEWVEYAFKLTYLLGFVGLTLSALGLSKDSNKNYAGLALFLGIINLAVFGLIFSA